MSTAPVHCFRVDPLPKAARILHRYQGLYEGWRCGPKCRHEANVQLDVVDRPLSENRRMLTREEMETLLAREEWPARCANAGCPIDGGYSFAADDPRAVMLERIGRSSDTEETGPISEARIGAILDVSGHVATRGPDGRSLAVVTPDGLWYFDAPLRGGQTWTRTGEAPLLTTVQTSGPPYAWRILDGVLERVDGGTL